MRERPHVSEEDMVWREDVRRTEHLGGLKQKMGISAQTSQFSDLVQATVAMERRWFPPKRKLVRKDAARRIVMVLAIMDSSRDKVASCK